MRPPVLELFPFVHHRLGGSSQDSGALWHDRLLNQPLEIGAERHAVTGGERRADPRGLGRIFGKLLGGMR